MGYGGAAPGQAPRETPQPVRVALTLEQCWHRVPGGTATSVLGLAAALDARRLLALAEEARQRVLGFAQAAGVTPEAVHRARLRLDGIG